MKILFVRPRPSDRTIGLQHVMLVEPLELEVLAALVGPFDEPVIVDLVLERRDLAHFLGLHRPDLLCVTGYITNVPAMIQSCRLAKRLDPKIATVVGGVHCEVCPEDLDDPAVDFRVVRNATRSFPALLSHLRKEGARPPGVFGPGEPVERAALPAFDFHFPRPRRDLTRAYRRRYFYIFHDRVALLKTAFGCPFKCSFCFCRAITSDRYHERPLEEVLDELASIEEREIYVVDDDFLVSVARVEAFLDGVERRGLDKSFLIYGRADFVARNPEVMARFARDGLRTVIVGFESFAADELAGYRKGVDPGANAAAMEVLNRLGIDCFATLIVPPTWGPEDFANCGLRLRELGIHFVNLQPLTPLPGTDYTASDQELLVPRSDFEVWDLAHAMVRPTRLSVPEFYRHLIALYQEVLFRPGVLARYAVRYSPPRLLKMALGSFRVRGQYLKKMREAAGA